MSHSITTGAAYVLNKYSRSYPPTSSSASQVPVESEWQHFTNPVMRIVLEAKKSPSSGQLESMRLRILWSLHTGSDDLYTDQREVVFEDLELLSFSSLPTFQASTAQSDHSLPIKAVYRDAVVGIRYLHPRIVAPGSYPTYRRFQITFKDVSDASRLIDAIKSVCPCKANPQSTSINRHSTMLPTLLARSATVSGPAPMRTAGLTERQTITLPSTDSRPPVPSVLSHLSRNPDLSILPPSSLATSLSSDDSAFVTRSGTSDGTDAAVGHRRDGVSGSRGAGDVAPSSLPNSSQPSSSGQSTTMPPPPVPRRATHFVDAVTQEPSRMKKTDDERSQFLAALSKHPSVYELSRTDLETLVSQVIREEGFRRLLESLDSLWSAKGFLGH